MDEEGGGRTLAIPSSNVPLTPEFGPSASHNSLSSSLDVALPPLPTDNRGAEADVSSSSPSSGALKTMIRQSSIPTTSTSHVIRGAKGM